MDLPLLENSDDFVFDNEMLAQCICFGLRIGEVSCPTKYFKEASSINFSRSVKYGFGVLGTTMKLALQRRGVAKFRNLTARARSSLPIITRPRGSESRQEWSSRQAENALPMMISGAPVPKVYTNKYLQTVTQ